MQEKSYCMRRLSSIKGPLSYIYCQYKNIDYIALKKLAKELQFLEKAWQEIGGDNRWKPAAGGRPSKAAEGDTLGHQTTVLQHIGKLHAAIVKSWAPNRVSEVHTDEQLVLQNL